MRAASLGFRLFDAGRTTATNLAGQLPALVRAAGFAETELWMTPFWTPAFIRAAVTAAERRRTGSGRWRACPLAPRFRLREPRV